MRAAENQYKRIKVVCRELVVVCMSGSISPRQTAENQRCRENKRLAHSECFAGDKGFVLAQGEWLG